jgi:magnesium-transporting ATPase (P-type)
VARQASDLVLAADDFSSLVEALVEGRSFWSNTRRALGLLLGGNLGELAMVVGASVLGLPTLATRQILGVNLITDIFPGLAVALQRPEHRHLAGLAREGTAALDSTLRRDVWRRAVATGLPSLTAQLVAQALGLPDVNAVAFASIVLTQLVQTLDVARLQGGVNRQVLAGVLAAGAALGVTFAAPPLRTALALALPTPLGWGLIGLSALAALLISRTMGDGANGKPVGLAIPGWRLLPTAP